VERGLLPVLEVTLVPVVVFLVPVVVFLSVVFLVPVVVLPPVFLLVDNVFDVEVDFLLSRVFFEAALVAPLMGFLVLPAVEETDFLVANFLEEEEVVLLVVKVFFVEVPSFFKVRGFEVEDVVVLFVVPEMDLLFLALLVKPEVVVAFVEPEVDLLLALDLVFTAPVEVVVLFVVPEVSFLFVPEVVSFVGDVVLPALPLEFELVVVFGVTLLATDLLVVVVEELVVPEDLLKAGDLRAAAGVVDLDPVRPAPFPPARASRSNSSKSRASTHSLASSSREGSTSRSTRERSVGPSIGKAKAVLDLKAMTAAKVTKLVERRILIDKRGCVRC